MKVTYTLYSTEFKQGLMLTVAKGWAQVHLLESHYREIYGNNRFRVTRKEGRQKEIRVTGYWEG